MSISPVMTITDELLAELEEAASNATPGPWSYDGYYICTMRQDGETVYAESWNPVADALLSKNVKYISAANPSTITALTAELRRLRAENAELAKDAWRYQWLRNQSMEYRQNGPAAIMAEVSGEKGTFLELDDLDTAIDTAMEQAK